MAKLLAMAAGTLISLWSKNLRPELLEGGEEEDSMDGRQDTVELQKPVREQLTTSDKPPSTINAAVIVTCQVGI